jgi:hypothetical protein
LLSARREGDSGRPAKTHVFEVDGTEEDEADVEDIDMGCNK